MYGSFLQKWYCKFLSTGFCHTCTNYFVLAPKEYWSCALPPDEGFEALEAMDFEAKGVTLDSCSTYIPSTEVKASRPNTNAMETQNIERDFENEGSHHSPQTPGSLPVFPNLSPNPS
jgi:hypothetical protein